MLNFRLPSTSKFCQAQMFNNAKSMLTEHYFARLLLVGTVVLRAITVQVAESYSTN